MTKQNQLTLNYSPTFAGDVVVPGSKSLSNRALLLAALCDGPTKITNLLKSDDINHMLNALAQLGVRTELNEDATQCLVHGVGGRLDDPEKALFLGNAGTAMRPLAAVLAVKGVQCELTGEPRMYERPIKHLIDAMKPLSLSVDYIGTEGFPPLRIGKSSLGEASLDEIKLEIDGSVSSQYLTALLMAMPLLNRPVTIVVIGELVSKPYILLTLDIMKQFGVNVETSNKQMQSFSFTGKERYVSPENYMVEGDASSASYFLAAGAISGGPVNVYGVGKNSVQGDIQFAEVLAAMGAEISYFDDRVSVSRTKALKNIDMDMNHIPDAAMTITTTALFAEGTAVLRNIYNWRVKETDRLHAMATELQKVGAIVEEGHDFIKVTAPSKINHAEIDTYDDHRIAMCFSLLALHPVGITINDPQVTSKTFPDFFERFSKLVTK